MHHSSFVLRILVLALLVCASPRSPKVTEEGSALELRCRHTLQVRAKKGFKGGSRNSEPICVVYMNIMNLCKFRCILPAVA